ncbi:PTS glucitol/sorbitol transporter subunit IIA [Ammoniphilus sp. 3BR4]|uniref:PTS glucitol/sorbitol transporter subunit IIA n=1 Tax=Ammoniphilus sp. 3BR4 TaxID=3158265 RepID=UPI00346662B9
MIQSVVSLIGEMALSFEEEKVLIFFGPNAPEELKEVSVIQELKEHGDQPLAVGDKLVVGDQEYRVTSLGSEAYHNLLAIGHISIYFTEAPADVLPGSVYVTPHVLPKIEVGTKIQFIQG